MPNGAVRSIHCAIIWRSERAVRMRSGTTCTAHETQSSVGHQIQTILTRMETKSVPELNSFVRLKAGE